MPLPTNIVPKPLIPLFRGGGIKQLLDFAAEFGTGLAFINQLSRFFPRDPSVPYWYYQQLTGWVNAFTRDVLAAGDYLTNLSNRGLIQTDVLPRNFFLKRPDSLDCNYWFKVSYQTNNTITGRVWEMERALWQPDVGTGGQLRRSIIAKLQEESSYVSASANAAGKYLIVPESLRFIGAVRTC